MAITFPSKTGKKRSILLDAFRILAWEEYRATNKESLKESQYGGYEVFEAEWKSHDIHGMSYVELLGFAKSLEFAENDLLNLRSNYYAKKGNFSRSSKSNGSGTSETLPETVTQLASVIDDSDDSGDSQELPKYDEAPF
ncbi:hypothetical protein [Microcoleus sp. Pol10D4]|uniref:hypothetical protein n=1 Tax=Microcoleus sp. Pol10D4 TaxID=3055387 RepID=UPI002FD70F34